MPRGRRSKNPNRGLFCTYIYKVLKQVHPDVGLSNKAMSIMDDFVQFTLRKLANQTEILCTKEQART